MSVLVSSSIGVNENVYLSFSLLVLKTSLSFLSFADISITFPSGVSNLIYESSKNPPVFTLKSGISCAV